MDIVTLTKEIRDSWKFALIITFTTCAAVVTVYGHAVVKTSVIFSHFFYIPIAMAAVWWMRKGIFVALFLSVLLISSHLFFLSSEPILDDVVRCFFFLFISLILINLKGALLKSEIRFRELFDKMGNGVAVYEAKGPGDDFVFKDINPAGAKLSKVKKEEIVDRSVLDLFPGIKNMGLLDVLRRVWKTGVAEHHPVTLYEDQRISHWVENDVYKLPSGELVVVFDDVTDRKQVEEERERLILELKQALSRIRTLSGLLPICASCKSIRNDEGYWEQLEVYIQDRSDAEFSHGICPECKKKLYPELNKK